METKRVAVVAVAAKQAVRGGSRSGVHIGDQLSPAQRAVVERIETRHGSPPGTVMLGGWRVSLEDSQPQGEIEQQTQSAEQTEDAQQGEQVEEAEQAAQPQP